MVSPTLYGKRGTMCTCLQFYSLTPHNTCGSPPNCLFMHEACPQKERAPKSSCHPNLSSATKKKKKKWARVLKAGVTVLPEGGELYSQPFPCDEHHCVFTVSKSWVGASSSLCPPAFACRSILTFDTWLKIWWYTFKTKFCESVRKAFVEVCSRDLLTTVGVNKCDLMFRVSSRKFPVQPLPPLRSSGVSSDRC